MVEYDKPCGSVFNLVNCWEQLLNIFFEEESFNTDSSEERNAGSNLFATPLNGSRIALDMLVSPLCINSDVYGKDCCFYIFGHLSLHHILLFINTLNILTLLAILNHLIII